MFAVQQVSVFDTHLTLLLKFLFNEPFFRAKKIVCSVFDVYNVPDLLESDITAQHHRNIT